MVAMSPLKRALTVERTNHGLVVLPDDSSLKNLGDKGSSGNGLTQSLVALRNAQT